MRPNTECKFTLTDSNRWCAINCRAAVVENSHATRVVFTVHTLHLAFGKQNFCDDFDTCDEYLTCWATNLTPVSVSLSVKSEQSFTPGRNVKSSSRILQQVRAMWGLSHCHTPCCPCSHSNHTSDTYIRGRGHTCTHTLSLLSTVDWTTILVARAEVILFVCGQELYKFPGEKGLLTPLTLSLYSPQGLPLSVSLDALPVAFLVWTPLWLSFILFFVVVSFFFFSTFSLFSLVPPIIFLFYLVVCFFSCLTHFLLTLWACCALGIKTASRRAHTRTHRERQMVDRGSNRCDREQAWLKTPTWRGSQALRDGIMQELSSITATHPATSPLNPTTSANRSTHTPTHTHSNACTAFKTLPQQENNNNCPGQQGHQQRVSEWVSETERAIKTEGQRKRYQMDRIY